MTKNSLVDETSVGELLDSEIRFRIFSLLSMYPELSFTELSQKLNKSKSTLHPHLKKLIEDLDLVEISKKVNRGGNPAQYYSLKPGYEEKTKQLDTDFSKGLDERQSKIFISRGRNWLLSVKKTIGTAIKFLDQLEKSDEGLKILEEIYIKKRIGTFNSVAFLSEEAVKKVEVLFFELCNKMNQIELEEKKLHKNIERPYYFYAGTLPLKMIIENLNKLPKKKIKES